ncbi:mobilization protein [Streptomyces sp. NPDC056544]|uniref:mobilization protein n=1 Tax=unclassified Streptomyces TaxID=2593676 RepID=UPI00368CC38D
MPKKAAGGSTTAELLDYLFGPGQRDEHTDLHLGAGWDPDLPCPARHPERITRADLALLLDAPVEALRGVRPAEHVWHVSVRNHPDDPILFDDQWAQVAAATVHAAGGAEHGYEHACRWIAVRHATDHIHILATLARHDGRPPRLRGDILAMHTAARVFEARWGLTPMSPLDRTARRSPVTGETAKAARRGLAETARESPQRTVRSAAALAQGDTDFLDRLRDAGLPVRERHGDDGTLVGYAVALPGDRADRGSRLVWFADSTLAYDLSLHRVRERFTPHVTPADWALAEHRIREASALLGRAGQASGAGDVAALGDLLAVAAAHSPALVRDRVRAAADAFEQAARAPGARSLEGRACRMAGLHPRVGARTERRSLNPSSPSSIIKPGERSSVRGLSVDWTAGVYWRSAASRGEACRVRRILVHPSRSARIRSG